MNSQILFISDIHLGTPNYECSLAREIKVCKLLDNYKATISELYIVGDLFDFWFEYKNVTPKGYYRILGKLAELSDQGIKITYFTGNHDMWIFDFFKKELKATIFKSPQVISINNKKIFIGHGDGLGPKDYKYKFLKKFFASSICQFLFRWIHPDIGVGIANYFSYKSRYSTTLPEEKYLGNKNEWLYVFCKDYINSNSDIDYFIFGHRHFPIYTQVESSSSFYINLGDWLQYDTYALFDGKDVHLLQNDSNKNNHDFNPTDTSV